ncbi:MAG: hypothetical protein ABL894_04255 [Hyphomicrobium sp.]
MPHQKAERIANCCSEAMFGYAEAATAMWWGVANEAIDACGRAVKAAAPEAEAKPTSWFNPNADSAAYYGQSPANFARKSSAQGFPDPMAWLGLFAAPSSALPGAMSLFSNPVVPAVNPFEVWFNMFPLRGGPAAWPMAFFMLSAGMPKSVAWPTATANAAMMEAAEVATGQMQSAFSSFRSDSGYASAANFNGWGPAAMYAKPATYWPYSV